MKSLIKVISVSELTLGEAEAMRNAGQTLRMTPEGNIEVWDDMGNIFDREEEKRIESNTH